jgi:hypothetical protein
MAAPRVLLVDDEVKILQGRAERGNPSVDPVVLLTTGPARIQRLIMNLVLSSLKEGGTGLGLFVVYQLVKENGGMVEVQSEPGKGTEFILYLKPAKGGSYGRA